MSAYITVPTPMIDRECLLTALAELGFGAGMVEVHETPVTLRDPFGATAKAHVVVPARHLGAGSDLGFLETPTGIRAQLRGVDGRFRGEWLERLRARHDAHLAAREARLAEERRLAVVEARRAAIVASARRQGYEVRETREQGRVRLVMQRRV